MSAFKLVSLCRALVGSVLDKRCTGGALENQTRIQDTSGIILPALFQTHWIPLQWRG